MVKLDVKKLQALELSSIAQVHAFLFGGSPLGGRSLTSLLDAYIDAGPYSPVRGELQKHLVRCLDALITMDSTIVARCHLGAPKPTERALKGSKKSK